MARQQLVQRALSVCAFRLRRFRNGDREEIEQCIAASVLRALASGVHPQRNLDGLLEWRGRAEITTYVRSLIRDRRLEHIDAVLEHAGHETAPFDLVAADELRRFLSECIERVPSRDQRDAVRHRLIEGLSAAEIAQRKAVKAAVARVWIARAAVLVRACVQQKITDSRGP